MRDHSLRFAHLLAIAGGLSCLGLAGVIAFNYAHYADEGDTGGAIYLPFLALFGLPGLALLSWGVVSLRRSGRT